MRRVVISVIHGRLRDRREALKLALDTNLSELAAVRPTEDDFSHHELVMGTSASLVEEEGRELGHVEDAIGRIKRGSYGICQDCGKQISAARLVALPHASRCIHCQRKAERNLVLV